MNNGICLLCAAVIDKARQDYVTGPDCNLAALEKFVRSDLFQLYSMGLNPDPETVLRGWREERREYRAKLIRNGKRVVSARAQKGIYQAPGSVSKADQTIG